MGNAARDWELRSLRSLFRPLAYVARDLVELAVGYCYYGERIPMDPAGRREPGHHLGREPNQVQRNAHDPVSTATDLGGAQ